MQIIFESRDSDGAQMRELSIARVRFTLRRLSAMVPRGYSSGACNATKNQHGGG